MNTLETPRTPHSPALEQQWQKSGQHVKRAKQLWDTLRNSVKLSTDLMKKADTKPSTVTHGIHHQRKLNHDEPLHCVIYNTIAEEIITLDSQFIRVFYKDGRRKDIVDPGEPIMNLIWSSACNQYIAQTSDHQMKLLNSNLEFISTATFQHSITCMTCNESTNEVVTAGMGNVTSWCFRYGNRYLIPRKVITQGLSLQDEFDNIILESSASKSQRCYASCGTGVAIFNIHQGKMLGHKRDLHVRNITSLLFINPLKYIVTGSRDGSIKLWDDAFEVKHVFVGHHGPVAALALYPLGPYFMSASYDCTVRLWSLETYDEVDLLKTDEPVEGMSTIPDVQHLFTFSAFMVDLWNIGHIHQIFTSVGMDVFSMGLTSHSNIPDRVLVQSRDDTVRVISPTNGGVLTTLIPFHAFPSTTQLTHEISKSKKSLVDAVYCVSKETIFAAYSDGSVAKAWTATNPASILKVWKFEDKDVITCLCLYEYILSNAELLETWRQSKESPKGPKIRTKVPKYGNKVLLLAGRADGSIASIDINRGKVMFHTDAHGIRGVIGIISNVPNDQVVTAGRDNVVKVWRMFPNAVEALSLLMSFYCAHTPYHMTIALSRLVVAFQQPATATYSVVIYDLKTKERYDHSPEDDHINDITGLSACPRLKLFASSSKDGTIRIWNHDNVLIRTLKINAEPYSIEFCSQQGDLLVGLGGNVHRIEHKNYLPQMYLFKMVCMEFVEQVDETPVPLDESTMRYLAHDMARCVKEAKSSYMKFDYAWDPMTTEELLKMKEESGERMDAFGELALRENELSGIRDGLVRAKKKVRYSKKRTETRAFKKYMELFYRRPKKMIIPEPDDFSPDPPEPRIETPEEWTKEAKTGFFPPIDAAKPMKEILQSAAEKDKHFEEFGEDYEPASKYIVNPTGFIPNSILARFLWSQEDVEKQKEENVWKPPTLSEEQMAELTKKKPQVAIDLDDVPTFEFNLATPSEEGFFWDDEEGSEAEAIGPSAGKPEDTQKTLQEKKKAIEKQPSKLMEKLRGAMKTPSPPPTPPPESPPPQPPPKAAISPKAKQPAKPSKPIVKFVSKPPPPPPAPKSPPPPATQPKPHTPTPPRVATPPTPEPGFLTQFNGLPWFERYKDYVTQRVKRPYDVGQFFNIISDLVGIATDWDVKRAVADALLLLWQQEDIKDKRHMIMAINLVLNSLHPPSPKDAEQAQFIRSALVLYNTVLGGTEEVVLELLTQYLEGDTLHKNFVKNILIQLGMRDSHNYLSAELETWEIWNLNESTPVKQQIKEMARRWVKEWEEKFKMHSQQILEQLKKGDLKGNIRKTTPGETPEYLKSALSSRGASKQGTPRVRFMLQDRGQTGEDPTPIEVINYFCEMTLEAELERTRKADAKPEPTKNTVLVLPKLSKSHALIRLGEMHTAHRARARQELAAEYKLNPLQRPYPDLMAGFASKIILPLHTMHMNPFPSPIDKYEEDNIYQPVLLTLRAVHQRYFVPERSYVHLS